MVRKRSVSRHLFWIIPLIILIVVGIGFSAYMGVFQEAIATQKEIQVAGQYIYGLFSCEPSQSRPYENTLQSNLPKAGITISNVKYDYSPLFTTTIHIPRYSAQDAKRIFYKVCKKDDPNNCDKSSGESIPTGTTQPITRVLPNVREGETIFFRLEDYNSGKCIIPSSKNLDDNTCWTTWDTQPQATYSVEYQVFRLWRKDVLQGGEITTSETCASAKTTAQKLGLKLITASNLGNKEAFIQDVSKDRLLPYERWNYITGIVLTVGVPETYMGQEAICQDNTMFGLSTVKTLNGNYKIVDQEKNLGRVDCCNNVPLSTTTICKDHKIVPLEQQGCSITNPCKVQKNSPQIYSPDSSRKTVFWQECNKQTNSCEQKTKEVECASDIACSRGSVCQNFECVQTGADVGEKQQTGKKGLDEECSWYDFSCNFAKQKLIIALIVFIVVTVVTIFFLMRYIPVSGLINGIIGLIVGILAGILLFVSFNIVVWVAIGYAIFMLILALVKRN